MGSFDQRWVTTTALEMVLRRGAHIDELGKAHAVMEQMLAKEDRRGDITVEHDDEHIILRAVVGTSTHSTKPQFSVMRGGEPRSVLARDADPSIP